MPRALPLGLPRISIEFQKLESILMKFRWSAFANKVETNGKEHRA